MPTCPLTSGKDYGSGCEAFAGGVRAIYLLESYNKNTFTAVAGVVTVMTLQASTAFRRYVPKKNTATWSDNGTKNETGAVGFEPTIQMDWNSLETSYREEILLMFRNSLIVIVLDTNGIYRLFGYDNLMDLMTAGADGGKLIADGQKSSLVFKGAELRHAYQITSPSILTAIGVVAP